MAAILKMPIIAPEYPGYLDSYPKSDKWYEEIDENNEEIYMRLKEVYGAENINIIGRSLGTSFASKLASNHQCK